MKQIPLIVMMSISMFANAAKPGSDEQDSLPPVEQQLKVLNEKLGLTAKQQATVKPILQHLHDVTEKIMQDQALSREQRLAKVRPQRQMADAKMRAILSAQQRKQLDQYEQGPHAEMHGTLSGTPKPPDR